jgi:hypothetical protein
MSITCHSRHQSYASFRLEVFQSLFNPASIRSQYPPSPKVKPRHGKVQHGNFTSSSKLCGQKGSRNFKEDDPDLRAFLEERLVAKGLIPKRPPQSDQEPILKDEEPPSKDEESASKPEPERPKEHHSQWSPYREEVRENLKGLLQDLKSAASTAQVFEEDFTARPTGKKTVEIMPTHSPLLNRNDFPLFRIRLDPGYEKFEEEYLKAGPVPPNKRVKIESDEPPFLRATCFKHWQPSVWKHWRPSVDLPESPVMRRLRKERKHKREPTAEEQSALSDNPWACILASHVRHCQATGVRLPVDLLVPWTFVQKRSNDLTYLMPAGLADMKKLKPSIDSEGSQLPERSEGERSATDEFTNTPLPSKLTGKTNLLPYLHLIKRITEKVTRRDNKLTNRGAVASLLNQRTKTAFDEAQHYAENPEEKTRLDLTSLKWDFEIPKRILHIMRERVLTALESLGALNESAGTIVPIPVKVLETGRMIVAIGSKKDESKSPTFSFRAVDAMPEPSPRVPSRKAAQMIEDRFAGSFLLNINSDPLVIPDQPKVVLARSTPGLLPQTVSVNNTVRVPVFNLRVMMGFTRWDGGMRREKVERYKAVLKGRGVLDVPKRLGSGGQLLLREVEGKEEPGYLLFVEKGAPMARELARELWQLWRYQGGWGGEMKGVVTAEAEAKVDDYGKWEEEAENGANSKETRTGQPSNVWREELGIKPISISA